MKTEKRTITAHPQLIFDVLTRQAGTISKAILEGIMNSADASATRCDITITEKEVVISDNGTGITDTASIQSFFETLGTPHSESEQKKYGTFRMGRGQMFSFGVNVWRTSEFMMEVDIKNKGLDYNLNSGMAHVDGCKIVIALYTPLYPSDVAEVSREVAKMAKYCPLDILVNGKIVSVDPETERWDEVTKEAYIRMNSSSGLVLYNLGVFVREYGNWQYGCGGVIVSKLQLNVNFARNDVMVNDCKVWKKIKKTVNQKATEKNKNKPILDDGERQRLAHQIISGEVGGTFAADAKVFTDVTGKHISAFQINKCFFANNISHAPKGDRRGDKLMQSKTIMVLATETLERFDTNLSGLISIIKSSCGQNHYNPTIVDYVAATKSMNEYHVILDKAQWTARESMFLDIFSSQSHIIEDVCNQSVYSSYKTRRVVIGSSPSASAWTDGYSYIAFSREYIKSLAISVEGLVDFFSVGLHEYCHSDNDASSHVHGLDFYQKYHDAISCVGKSVNRAVSSLEQTMRRHNVFVTKQALKVHGISSQVKQMVEKCPELTGGVENNPEKISAQVKQVVRIAKQVVDSGRTKNPYNVKSSYGILFLLGSIDFIDKEVLLKACSEATGKSLPVLAMSLQVLSNPSHRSNNNRSMIEKNKSGLIMLVSLI